MQATGPVDLWSLKNKTVSVTFLNIITRSSLLFLVCLPRISIPGFPGGSVVKNPPANAGDMGLIPGFERSAKEGSDKPLQYYCLENSMDRKSLEGYSPQGRKRVRYNLVTK